jgi:hypothetical protein
MQNVEECLSSHFETQLRYALRAGNAHIFSWIQTITTAYGSTLAKEKKEYLHGVQAIFQTRVLHICISMWGLIIVADDRTQRSTTWRYRFEFGRSLAQTSAYKQSVQIETVCSIHRSLKANKGTVP